MKRNVSDKTIRMVFAAFLAALVVVLQFWGNSLTIGPLNLSFVLIPIALAGIMLGPLVGGFLGLLFGIMTLFTPFAIALMEYQGFFTVLVCLLKGMLAGFGAGIIYQVLASKNKTVAIFAAAVATPVINTGVFVLGTFLLRPAIELVMGREGSGYLVYVLVSLVGLNFLVELAINLIASPALHKLANLAKKKFLS